MQKAILMKTLKFPNCHNEKGVVIAFKQCIIGDISNTARQMGFMVM